MRSEEYVEQAQVTDWPERLALVGLTVLVILLALAGSAAAAADLPRPAVECTPRVGLPNFFAKAKAFWDGFGG